MSVVETAMAPEALGPYSQGRIAGGTLYTAGQIGIDPATGTMADGAEAQVGQVLANVRAIVEAGGSDLSSIVKLTVYLTNLGNWPIVNAAMVEMFAEPYPARSAVGVAALPFGALVEIEAVAFVTK